MKSVIYNIDENRLIYNGNDINVNEKNLENIFFDSYEFHNYHKKNCEQVYKVINFKKNKVIGIYYFGIKENEAHMPYSSPFSQILLAKGTSYKDLICVIDGMNSLCKDLNLKAINISLPPFFYNNSIETQFLMLINNGFKINYVDINHYFDLVNYNGKDEFISFLPHAQRKNYKRTINENLKFYKVNNDEFEEAFKVIEINRNERGYPLRMDREQIRDILKFNNEGIDFFVVKDQYGDNIAAAMVYNVNSDTYQVIYWGHINEYSVQRPMSLLSVELCDYYKNKKVKLLDIGPSSESGNISINLAQFKVDMGCNDTSKFSLKKILY